MIDNEEWRTVANGAYSVSSLGRVRRELTAPGTRKGRILKPGASGLGYRKVTLHVGGRGRVGLIHRLVAEAFLGPVQAGLEVNHRNGDKTDNRVVNLEIVSHSENMRHGFRLGLYFRKLTPEQADEIRKARRAGVSAKELSRKYGINLGNVYAIALGRKWKSIA